MEEAIEVDGGESPFTAQIIFSAIEEKKKEGESGLPPDATPWTGAYQDPPMGFSRQEYWSGVPLPSMGSHRVRHD